MYYGKFTDINGEIIFKYLNTLDGKGAETLIAYELEEIPLDSTTSISTIVSSKLLNDNTEIKLFDNLSRTYTTTVSVSSYDDTDFSNTDPFNDGSLIAQFKCDDNFDDNTGNNTSTNDGSLTFVNDLFVKSLSIDNTSVSDNTIQFDSGLSDTLVDELTVCFYISNFIPHDNYDSIFIGSKSYIDQSDTNNTWHFKITDKNRGSFVIDFGTDGIIESESCNIQENHTYFCAITHKKGSGTYFFVYDLNAKEIVLNNGSEYLMNNQIKQSVVIGKPSGTQSQIHLDQLEVYSKQHLKSDLLQLVSRKVLYSYDISSVNIFGSSIQKCFINGSISVLGDFSNDNTSFSLQPETRVLSDIYNNNIILEKYQLLDSGDYFKQKVQGINIHKIFMLQNVFGINPLDPFGDNSCIAYYPFDGNANDATGNGYDGTIVDGTFVNGISNQAIYNDKEDRGDTVVLSNTGIEHVLSSNVFSTNFWGKIQNYTISDSEYNIFSVGTGYYAYNCGNMRRAVRFNSNQYIMYSECPEDYASSEFIISVSFGIYPDNIYHMFTVIKDGQNIKVYLDGELKNSTNQGYIDKPVMHEVTVLGKGQSNLGNRLRARGSIDNLRIFNRALTEEEVQLLYQYKL